ncbi:OmpA/MotB family protein [[Clostridium] fimetarium]|uniref:Chemotaxis protein MotB n=1 Tax=[Clostridium] fimetarium TaxID=99656 RepID=A0A1I0RFP7_9FIRM|nr:flagellar motor protein MotB [[Clostridium] fimetarium]SEW39732.1 chemotaxis protein MotB [[Clostridium] fimetarium]
MKKKKHKEGNSERWLLTYADMLTLLFVLFVVLFAMSNINSEKLAAVSGSLNAALGNGSGTAYSILDGGVGLLEGGVPVETQAATEAATVSPTNSSTNPSTQSSEQKSEQSQIKGVKENIDKIISTINVGGDIGINIKESGLVITFPSGTFFDSGKAVLKDNMKEALKKIAVELNTIDNTIVVNGYTDNVTINNSIYASNWQLSAARAANVAQYLDENCQVDRSRLIPAGLGENNPVASNDTLEGKSKNRRVEIQILYSYKEVIE